VKSYTFNQNSGILEKDDVEIDIELVELLMIETFFLGGKVPSVCKIARGNEVLANTTLLIFVNKSKDDIGDYRPIFRIYYFYFGKYFEYIIFTHILFLLF
jgi:hypothetical protein